MKKGKGTPINLCDEAGNIVKQFNCISAAAKYLGIASPTMTWRLQHRTVVNGLHVEYAEEHLTKEQEERRKRQRERVLRLSEEEREQQRKEWRDRAYKRRLDQELDIKRIPSGEMDDMTIEQTERMIEDFKAIGLSLERLKYKLWGGVKSITPCRKKEKRDFEEWPAIGSLKCLQCRYFKGRCRETQEVLCAYKSCNGVERIERRGRNKKD